MASPGRGSARSRPLSSATAGKSQSTHGTAGIASAKASDIGADKDGREREEEQQSATQHAQAVGDPCSRLCAHRGACGDSTSVRLYHQIAWDKPLV